MLKKIIGSLGLILLLLQVMSCDQGGATPGTVPTTPDKQDVKINIVGDFPTASEIVVFVSETDSQIYVSEFTINYDNKVDSYNIEVESIFKNSRYSIKAILLDDSGFIKAKGESLLSNMDSLTIRNDAPTSSKNLSSGVISAGIDILKSFNITFIDDISKSFVDSYTINNIGVQTDLITSSMDFVSGPSTPTISFTKISGSAEKDLTYKVNFTASASGEYRYKLSYSDGTNNVEENLIINVLSATINLRLQGDLSSASEIVVSILPLSGPSLNIIEQIKIPYVNGTIDYSVPYTPVDPSGLSVTSVINNASGNSLAYNISELDFNGERVILNDKPSIITSNIGPIYAAVNTNVGPIKIEINDDDLGPMVDLGFNFSPMAVTYSVNTPGGSSITSSSLIWNEIDSGFSFGKYTVSFTPDVVGTYEIIIICNDGINTTTKTVTIIVPGSNEGVVDVTIS